MNDITSRETLRKYWQKAVSWDQYLASVEKNRELWHGVYERARVPEDALDDLGAITTPVHFLALSEDWCGDAVNLLPVVARMAEASDLVDLRVLGRDENLPLMDAHLTGTSRSIPVVIVLDDEFRELGWWGPRPAEIQAWVLDHGLAMPSPDRYREVRRWYARDRGRTTVRELMDRIAPGRPATVGE
jgi:hypothetical protein